VPLPPSHCHCHFSTHLCQTLSILTQFRSFLAHSNATATQPLPLPCHTATTTTQATATLGHSWTNSHQTLSKLNRFRSFLAHSNATATATPPLPHCHPIHCHPATATHDNAALSLEPRPRQLVHQDLLHVQRMVRRKPRTGLRNKIK
jgi:hypothetical protein